MANLKISEPTRIRNGKMTKIGAIILAVFSFTIHSFLFAVSRVSQSVGKGFAPIIKMGLTGLGLEPLISKPDQNPKAHY